MATHIKNWVSKRGFKFTYDPIHCTKAILGLLREEADYVSGNEFVLYGSFKKRGPSIGITIASMMDFGHELEYYGVLYPHYGQRHSAYVEWSVRIDLIDEIHHELGSRLKRDVCGLNVPLAPEGRIAVMRRELVNEVRMRVKYQTELSKIGRALHEAGIRIPE